MRLPGFVNAHCHAFQRALRGRAEGADFWAWRELMLAEAGRQTVDSIRESTRGSTARCARRLHGRRRVPLPRARGGAAPPPRPPTRRDRARPPPRRVRARRHRALPPGFGRRSTSTASRRSARAGIRVGVAPHSVRACPRGLARGDRPLRGARGPAAPRPRGRAAARDRGVPRRARPAPDRAARADRLPRARARPSCTRRTRTATSSTCSREHGARICVCPTTEANLGDGFLPVERLLDARHRRSASAPTRTSASTRSRSCASSRASRAGRRGRRNVIPVDALLAVGVDEGAAALGLDAWPEVEVDLAHPSLEGVEEDAAAAALLFGASAEVFA